MLVAVAQAKLVQDQYQELRWAHDDLSEADPMADGAEAGEEDEELYRLRAPTPHSPVARCCERPQLFVLNARPSSLIVVPVCGVGLWCRQASGTGSW